MAVVEWYVIDVYSQLLKKAPTAHSSSQNALIIISIIIHSSCSRPLVDPHRVYSTYSTTRRRVGLGHFYLIYYKSC